MGLNKDIVWFSSDLVTKNLQEVPFSVHGLIFIETVRGPLGGLVFCNSISKWTQNRQCECFLSTFLWVPFNIKVHYILAESYFTAHFSSTIWIWQPSWNKHVLYSVRPKEFKAESALFLTPVLTLRGRSHLDRHIWRWVTVPSDLAQSFGMTCAHYHYHVIHRAITFMRLWFKSTWERQLITEIAWLA